METDTNESGTFCPLIKDECMQRKCKFYIKLKGTNPQTEQPFDYWDCAISWMPILLIENSHKQMQSTESINELTNLVAGKTPPVAITHATGKPIKLIL